MIVIMSREETVDRRIAVTILPIKHIRLPHRHQSDPNPREQHQSRDQSIGQRPQELLLRHIALLPIQLQLNLDLQLDPQLTRRHPITRALMQIPIQTLTLPMILTPLRAPHTLHRRVVTQRRPLIQGTPHREALILRPHPVILRPRRATRPHILREHYQAPLILDHRHHLGHLPRLTDHYQCNPPNPPPIPLVE